MNDTSNWKQLAAVQMGGAICLPIFIIGHALATQFGFVSAFAAVLIGNAVLLFLGIFAARFAAKTRMTTAETAAYTFGEIGRSYFALALVISMMGWFAIQLDMMSQMVGTFIGLDSHKVLNGVMGLVITGAALRGYKGLELLANICLPLLVATIIYAVYEASSSPFIAPMEGRVVLGGISVAIAAAIGAVIDMPTFFRRAKTTKDGVKAALILFGVALPLLEGVGIYLAGHGHGENFVESLAGTSPSLLWNGWIVLFIILAGWTTNNTNLYSAAISLKSIVKVKGELMPQVVLGVIGTFLSLFPLQGNLFAFLEVLGIMLAAAGGVMLVHQCGLAIVSRRGNLMGLALGLLAGAISFFGFSLTGAPLIDALIVSAVAAIAGGYCFIEDKEEREGCYDIC